MRRYGLGAMIWLLTAVLVGCGGGGGSSVSSVASSASWANMTVTSANQQTTVTWVKKSSSTSTKSSSFNLYWSTSPGVTKATGTRVASVTSPYTHTGLNNNVMYYYVVTEVVDGTEGPESLEVGITPRAMLPPTPAGTTVCPLNKAVLIKINRSSDATARYHLHWSSGNDTSMSAKITNAFGSGSTFTHTGLQNETPYYYAVTSETAEGESSKSPLVMAVPLADQPAVNYLENVSTATIAAPNAITAVSANQSVTLSWNMPASQVPTVFDPAKTPTAAPVISSYLVFWSTEYITDINESAKVNKLVIPVTAKTKLPISFTHNTNLLNGTAYYYLIGAAAETDAAGLPLSDGISFFGPTGSQVAVVPTARTPLPPTGITVASGTQQVSLKWAKSTATNVLYRVYYSMLPPATPEELVRTGTQAITTTATSYTHTGLSNGATYYYTVTAIDEGESAPGALVVVTLK